VQGQVQPAVEEAVVEGRRLVLAAGEVAPDVDVRVLQPGESWVSTEDDGDR